MHTQQLHAYAYDYVCILTPKVLRKTIDTIKIAQCASQGPHSKVSQHTVYLPTQNLRDGA